MIIKKAFKFRIYPTEEQRAELAIQFGHARFVYNWALARRKSHYKETGTGLSSFDINYELKELKNDPDTIWLKQADSQTLQQKSKDLQRAYVNFFEGRAKYPKRKKKKGKQSIRYPQRFKVEGRRIYAPKVGWIKSVIHRPIEGEMKSMTVSKTKSGRYFVSIQCEVEIDEPVYEGQHIGIDLGLKDFAILSDDSQPVENPKWLRKAEKKLARLQRQHSRKKKGSANREKARIKLARQHEKVANQRRDFHHKLSKQLVEKNRILTLENLNVKGMVKNRKLAKSISDAGWSQFVGFCQYKGEWYGCHTEKINRFFPSSKTCSECGAINHDLTLSDRTWVCTECGVIHDRDKNAAVNIKSNSPSLLSTVGTTESYAWGDCVRPDPAFRNLATVSEPGS